MPVRSGRCGVMTLVIICNVGTIMVSLLARIADFVPRYL